MHFNPDSTFNGKLFTWDELYTISPQLARLAWDLAAKYGYHYMFIDIRQPQVHFWAEKTLLFVQCETFRVSGALIFMSIIIHLIQLVNGRRRRIIQFCKLHRDREKLHWRGVLWGSHEGPPSHDARSYEDLTKKQINYTHSLSSVSNT